MKGSGSRGEPGADDDEELAAGSMREMRSVWRAMRDEEPPARGLDALMAAAGAQAARMRERAAEAAGSPHAEVRGLAEEDGGGRGVDARMAAARRRTDEMDGGAMDPPGRGLDALMMAARSRAVGGERARDAVAPAAFAVGSRPPDDDRIDDRARTASKRAATVPPAPAAPWQRFASTMRRPPALAFASVLLLVAGALVVTRHSVDEAPRASRVESSGAATTSEGPASTPSPAAPTQATGEAADAVSEPMPDGARGHAGDAKDSKGAQPSVIPKPPSARPAAAAMPAKNAGPPQREDAPALDALFREAEAAAARGDCARAGGELERLFQREPRYRARAAKSAPLTSCARE